MNNLSDRDRDLLVRYPYSIAIFIIMCLDFKEEWGEEIAAIKALVIVIVPLFLFIAMFFQTNIIVAFVAWIIYLILLSVGLNYKAKAEEIPNPRKKKNQDE